MGNDYRTGDNGRMKRYVLALLIYCLAPAVHAWNAGGHRLVAAIAWQQLSPGPQEWIATALARHPDHARWVEKAKSAAASAIFAEASTWPDTIRNDPRFYDEARQTPTAAIAGLPDNARHRHWHYVDLTPAGHVHEGEIDRQIERLDRLLRSTPKKDEITYALPWLLHLVGDIHQPLHVGHAQDEGGNQVEIENPFSRRQPFTNLHRYWDDLPAPSWLRGQRLEKKAAELVDRNMPPTPGTITLWRNESHQLLDQAYPPTNGSLLPLVTEPFQRNAQALAERRIVDAGYRLGQQLEAIFSARRAGETP